MVIGEGQNGVTLSLDRIFIGGSNENDILVGKVLISKKTLSLVFVKADLFKSDQVIATASGIWKILK